MAISGRAERGGGGVKRGLRIKVCRRSIVGAGQEIIKGAGSRRIRLQKYSRQPSHQ